MFSKNFIFLVFDFITPATPIAEGIIHFHHDLFGILVFICFFILWMLLATFNIYRYPNERNLVLTRSFHSFTYFKHKNTLLEIIWTLIPAFILMFISIPSFALLYSSSTYCNPEITYKIIGHQWYWSYEVATAKGSRSFDAYPVDANIVPRYVPRGIYADMSLGIPSRTYIRLLITSDDVLHSWAVPAFGVKVDACPGRLNSVNIIVKNTGTYFGACSEICGVNHAFMPIVVEVMTVKKLLNTL
jgi:heme/copper-type cytochrome/quinol oxidase subunit 2